MLPEVGACFGKISTNQRGSEEELSLALKYNTTVCQGLEMLSITCYLNGYKIARTL